MHRAVHRWVRLSVGVNVPHRRAVWAGQLERRVSCGLLALSRCVCMCVPLCVPVCECVRMCAHVCACVCMCVHVCACVCMCV